MLIQSLRRYMAVALPLAGSAILLFSCKAQPETETESVVENVMTEYSENISMTMSENGRKSYHFETPLIESYGLGHDPYREFRKGVKITIFDETTGEESASLRANYAIFYEDRKLWEAKGDVVATNSDGRQLYTSQLFWNQATHRVYSNVDSKIVDGDEVHHCEGFESDEEMRDWSYRKLKGVTYFDEEQFADKEQDSVAAEAKAEQRPASQPTAVAQPLRVPVQDANRTTARPKTNLDVPLERPNNPPRR